MQWKILKMNMALCVLIVAILVSSCKSKNDLKDQITITINSVDDNTKQNRVNMFDTIEVRVASWGIPVRRYVKVTEYFTDSTGSVKVKLNKNEEYLFMLGGKKNIYGATGGSKGELKEGQEVNIEVISLTIGKYTPPC